MTFHVIRRQIVSLTRHILWLEGRCGFLILDEAQKIQADVAWDEGLNANAWQCCHVGYSNSA